MTGHPFFTEILFVLIIATIVAVVFGRLRLPPIFGFLLAGFVIGPNGLALLSDTARIYQLAELGIILLMLTIGLEFKFERLRGLHSVAFFGGSLQIFLSIGISIIFAFWKGWTFYQGFILGAVIALSSTAIVLKYLIDRGELDTLYGRIAVAILVFQDLAVVPLMIFVIGLAGSPAIMGYSLGVALLKIIFLFVLVFVVARFFLPAFLHQVALSRSREIFFLVSAIFCLGTAWLSGQLGLSLAIGAFFAGLVFANTEYGYQLIGDLVSFRTIFVSLFFVSLGLLFDLRFTLANFGLIVSVVSLILVVNCVIMALIIMAFKYPPRIALASGLILAQIGEFSFLLLEAGRKGGGLDPFLYQILLSAAFLTMFMTPFLFALVPLVLRLSESISFFGIPPHLWKGSEKPAVFLKDHVLLCGFGPSGRDLAQTFQKENLPFLIVEMNPRMIRDARNQGFDVLYGDAANEEVMKRAGIAKARAVVVSFSDPMGMAQIIKVVERLNPEVLLVVRTRFEKDVPKLYELGADVVIMEELEASYELNRVILEHLQIPEERIKEHLERIQTRKELVIEEAIFKSHRAELKTGKNRG